MLGSCWKVEWSKRIANQPVAVWHHLNSINPDSFTGWKNKQGEFCFGDGIKPLLREVSHWAGAKWEGIPRTGCITACCVLRRPGSVLRAFITRARSIPQIPECQDPVLLTRLQVWDGVRKKVIPPLSIPRLLLAKPPLPRGAPHPVWSVLTLPWHQQSRDVFQPCCWLQQEWKRK